MRKLKDNAIILCGQDTNHGDVVVAPVHKKHIRILTGVFIMLRNLLNLKQHTWLWPRIHIGGHGHIRQTVRKVMVAVAQNNTKL